MDKKIVIREMLVQELPVGELVTEDKLDVVAEKLSVLPESVDWRDAEDNRVSPSSDKRKTAVDWGDAE
jgi:hypothetical protein